MECWKDSFEFGKQESRSVLFHATVHIYSIKIDANIKTNK